MKYRLLFLVLYFVGCQFLIKTPLPSQLIWPLKHYTISQQFAPVWNSSHQGIDLKADLGTPVFSSHSGQVVYAGMQLSGYGKTVIIEWSDNWSTLYAHLNEIQVQSGQYIEQGHQIGTVGQTGKATGAHLHFELLYQKQAINPLFYLND